MWKPLACVDEEDIGDQRVRPAPGLMLFAEVVGEPILRGFTIGLGDACSNEGATIADHPLAALAVEIETRRCSTPGHGFVGRASASSN